MARRNVRGLELTWHKPSKRWRKRIDGQDYWFGSGRGVSDRDGYRQARKKYRDYLTEDRYIARLRHKTTVPTKHKLWPSHMI